MRVEIGFGTATITPGVPVTLAGFGDRHAPAEAVHDELEVRAVVFGDGHPRLCLLVHDLLGMSRDASDAIRAAVGDELGLQPAAVLPACIHTHSGPSAITGSHALGWVIPPDYTDRLVAAGRAAAAAGTAAAESATLRWAKGALPDHLSVNRRGLPYEPWFAALSAHRPDGSVVGVLANMGVHPVSLGPEWLEVSADWVGPFRAELESRLGGTAVLVQSGLGDVNPPPHRCAPDFEVAAHLGRDVAVAVQSLVEGAQPLAGTGLHTSARWISAPIGTTPLAALIGNSGLLDVELVEWTIGSLTVVSVPGEPFHALTNAIDAARPGPVLIASLAPVWQGYFPVPFGDGYEESVSYGREAVEIVARALVG
jgi:hypothetical protein